MRYLRDITGLLAFRTTALRAIAERRSVWLSAVLFSAGFLLFAIVRNAVYATLLEMPEAIPDAGAGAFFQINLAQVLLFLAVVYVPVLIGLSNAISSDGLGFSLAREEYENHAAVLGPLWGALLAIGALVQWLIPHFLVLGEFVSISTGLLVLLVATAAYTVWVIRELNFLTTAAAAGVFVLSWITYPVFLVLTRFLLALPLLLLIPVLYLAWVRVQGFVAVRSGERQLRGHLESLTANPRDSDALYQLALIHLKRGNAEASRQYLARALEIDPADPDYHYTLGRAREAQGDWIRAREAYEETFRLSPGHGHKDILREVGKGYLHTGEVDKAVEFLRSFLDERGSDPEGRYWMAVALRDRGDAEGMRVELRRLLELARSNPRFFRRTHRQWIYRARRLLRGSP